MKQQTSAAIETRPKSRIITDYQGREIYVGIDVHKKDWQVGVFYSGLVLGNYRVTGSSNELISFLNYKYPGARLKCVYESCAWGFNLQRALQAAGMDCIVVHAGDVPGSDKEKQNKTDKVDAVRLARHHAAGLLQAIHVTDEEWQKQRNLVRFRKRLQADLNRSKHRLKSLLKFQGLIIPVALDTSHWSRNLMTWIQKQADQDKLLADTLLLMLKEVTLLRQLLLETERKLRALMKQQKYVTQMRLLNSMPGIGPQLSTLFLLEIGDIRRFKSFDQLNCFVGFYPGSDSSGEINRSRGISNRSHNQLRSLLVEAAWVAIRKDPAMLHSYQILIKTMKSHAAIIRIGRKLLRRIRAVLISGQQYQRGVVA